MPGYTMSETALDVHAVDELISAALRGEDVSWCGNNGAAFVETFLERCDYHGVGALLNEQLQDRRGWPTLVLDVLHSRALAQTMWELRHQHVLTGLLAALSKRGIHPVIFKGTALSYSLYTNPAWRARGDTDVIVPPQERVQADEALTSQGFKRSIGVSGEFISYQSNYTLKASGSGTHNIDLHWRINNSEVLSQLFSYEDLNSSAVPLRDLCPDAMAASPVHALLLACMHRAVHKQSPYYVNGAAYYSGDRLIWLYDIHLLASTFTSAQWQEFLNEARHKGLCATCLEGLQRARVCFHTSTPEFVPAALAQPGRSERVAVYLNASKLRRTQMDFRAIEGAGNKLRFMRELAFPSASYMRAKYPNAPTFWLPWLYARRAVGGVVKRLRTTQQTP